MRAIIFQDRPDVPGAMNNMNSLRITSRYLKPEKYKNLFCKLSFYSCEEGVLETNRAIGPRGSEEI